jgi:FMN phosphatase YigB (HAD superfamily)
MTGGGKFPERAVGRFIVFDLDGTLINIDSCFHLMADQKYEEFADATLECPPVENIVSFARYCQLMGDLLIVTAKPERLREKAINWLSFNGLQPEAILMRPKHDYRSSPELKLALLQEYIDPGLKLPRWQDTIMFAVEDRDKMVDAYRDAGITTFQCAPSLY